DRERLADVRAAPALGRAREQRVQLRIVEEVADRAALLEHLDALAIVDRHADCLAPARLGEAEQREREIACEVGRAVTGSDDAKDPPHGLSLYIGWPAQGQAGSMAGSDQNPATRLVSRR